MKNIKETHPSLKDKEHDYDSISSYNCNYEVGRINQIWTKDTIQKHTIDKAILKEYLCKLMEHSGLYDSDYDRCISQIIEAFGLEEE